MEHKLARKGVTFVVALHIFCIVLLSLSFAATLPSYFSV